MLAVKLVLSQLIRVQGAAEIAASLFYLGDKNPRGDGMGGGAESVLRGLQSLRQIVRSPIVVGELQVQRFFLFGSQAGRAGQNGELNRFGFDAAAAVPTTFLLGEPGCAALRAKARS